MAAKSGTRAKTAVKPDKKVSTAVKPAKKAVKKRTAAKAALERKHISELTDAEWLVRNTVPLAEVEVLAAKAVKMIKAKRTVSAEKKNNALARVARTLEHAKSMGGLSKGGAFDLKHPFGIGLIVHDWKAVLR
jgi:hypothetical protein